MKKGKSTKVPRERKANWQEVWATSEDIMAYLQNKVMLRRNMVTHQTEAHWLSEYNDEIEAYRRQLAEESTPMTDDSMTAVF